MEEEGDGFENFEVWEVGLEGRVKGESSESSSSAKLRSFLGVCWGGFLGLGVVVEVGFEGGWGFLVSSSSASSSEVRRRKFRLRLLMIWGCL